MNLFGSFYKFFISQFLHIIGLLINSMIMQKIITIYNFPVFFLT